MYTNLQDHRVRLQKLPQNSNAGTPLCHLWLCKCVPCDSVLRDYGYVQLLSGYSGCCQNANTDSFSTGSQIEVLLSENAQSNQYHLLACLLPMCLSFWYIQLPE